MQRGALSSASHQTKDQAAKFEPSSPGTAIKRSSRRRISGWFYFSKPNQSPPQKKKLSPPKPSTAKHRWPHAWLSSPRTTWSQLSHRGPGVMGSQAWHPTAASPNTSPGASSTRPTSVAMASSWSGSREQGAIPGGAAAPLTTLLCGQSFLQPPACKPSGASGPPALSPLLLFSRKSSYFMCRCSSLANWLGIRRRKCQEQPSIGACPRPPGPPGSPEHSPGQGAQGCPSQLEGKGFSVFGLGISRRFGSAPQGCRLPAT